MKKKIAIILLIVTLFQQFPITHSSVVVDTKIELIDKNGLRSKIFERDQLIGSHFIIKNNEQNSKFISIHVTIRDELQSIIYYNKQNIVIMGWDTYDSVNYLQLPLHTTFGECEYLIIIIDNNTYKILHTEKKYFQYIKSENTIKKTKFNTSKNNISSSDECSYTHNKNINYTINPISISSTSTTSNSIRVSNQHIEESNGILNKLELAKLEELRARARSAANITPDSGSGNRAYIKDGKLKYKGMDLYLAGASWGGGWDVGNTNPYGEQSVEMIEIGSEAGANFIFVIVNLRLYDDDYHDQFMSNFDVYIDKIVEEDMFFAVKLHDCAYRREYSFSHAGSNYKIAQDPYWRQKAIDMFVEMADKYKHLPNFIGVSPLNEPYSGSYDSIIWNDVNDFYVEVYDAVKKVDEYCILFCTAPISWGGANDMYQYKVRGYIPREDIIYEYHNYYDTIHASGEWGIYYENGDRSTGIIKYNQFLDNYVVPIINDGHSVFNGEFGTRHRTDQVLPAIPEAHLWKEALYDQMKGMEERGIHYAIFRLYQRRNNDHHYAMNDKVTFALNLSGQAWAENLPDLIVRP